MLATDFAPPHYICYDAAKGAAAPSPAIQPIATVTTLQAMHTVIFAVSWRYTSSTRLPQRSRITRLQQDKSGVGAREARGMQAQLSPALALSREIAHMRAC